MNSLISLLLVFLASYLFLSFCNWSLDIEYWNGFSRFLFGLIVLIGVISKLELN